MHADIKHWVGLWDYLDGNFWSLWDWCVAHLSPEEVGWQPVPQVASIGWNLEHLGEMFDYYLAHVFGHSAQVQHGPLPTMRSRSQDDGRYRDLDAIGAYHRQVRPAYRDFLSGLTAIDLDRILSRQGRQPLSWAWAIGHIAEHESYHVGKCTLLRSLLAAGNRRGHEDEPRH